MARLIRRFEPWCGVTRPMIEAEAKHLAREVESYLRLSLTELTEKLTNRGKSWHHADEALHAIVLGLPEREQLALRCLLVRDLHHILELYIEYGRTTEPQSTPPLRVLADVPRTPCSEWLFGA